jgi:hypothetical protein
MKELIFERKKLKITLDGSEHVVAFPSFFQLKEYVKKVQELGDYEGTCWLFEGLGLKKEVLDSLDMEQVNQILETITPDTKKK